MIRAFICGELLQFEYKNHEGKITFRRVIFRGLDFGENLNYPRPSWFMRCYDLDRQDHRSFALDNINVNSIQRVN